MHEIMSKITDFIKISWGRISPFSNLQGLGLSAGEAHAHFRQPPMENPDFFFFFLENPGYGPVLY